MTEQVGPPPRGRLARLPALGVLVAVLAAGAVAILCFRSFRAEVLKEADDDRPIRTTGVQVHASADGGPPLLTLEAGAMKSGAIVGFRLEATRFQPGMPAVGQVVDPDDLSEVMNACLAASEAAEQARAGPEPADAEDGGWSDDPGFDPAEGRLADAEIRATSATLRLRADVARAYYGPVVERWMQTDSAELRPFLQHRASLLLLTPLPGHDAVSLPAAAAVLDRAGKTAEAQLVSMVLRKDSRLQNVAGLYRTDDDPAAQRFVPARVVSGRLLEGPARDGVVAPAAAVFQFDARSWVYVEEAAGQYRRHEVSLGQSVPDHTGWFQEQGLKPGQTVVVAGAALLLAEER